ncbi:MAG TPA: citrate/2-methylcitrate synthase [Pyrinomonadaceae bacterium]
MVKLKTESQGAEEGAVERLFSELPTAPKYNPTGQAIERAKELGEQKIVTALSSFSTMPQSTSIIANPVLHHTQVDCNGTRVTLDIRSFTIRGIVPEADIVNGKAGPLEVIFVGLLGREPRAVDGDSTEEATLAALIDQTFFSSLGTAGTGSSGPSLISQIADFVQAYPGSGPEIAIQHFSTLRKAVKIREKQADEGLNEERDPSVLLTEMITVHMENVAIGAVTAYMNQTLSEGAGPGKQELEESARRFIEEERGRGRNAFEVCYSLILGRHANESECLILERMGTIQIHHGSAGSNMVARYMATLHTLSVSDFFTASQMAMDGARHFGAIHDMTAFVHQLESRSADERRETIRGKVLGGGLPTFGHPEIAAAGRGNTVQQDPRPAIYIDPLFTAISEGTVTLSERQRNRLAIARQIYNIAFVEGVLKPQREHEAPLRLTANTDFGAWCVQEGLGIEESNRTLLTYIFRGFGWMMDAREQLQQKMIRPVIAPDPQIIPTASEDSTIPQLVERVHHRLTREDPFSPEEA